MHAGRYWGLWERMLMGYYIPMPPDETPTPDPVSQPASAPETAPAVSGDPLISSPTAVSGSPDTSPEAPEASISVPDPSLVNDQNPVPEASASQTENSQNQDSFPAEQATQSQMQAQAWIPASAGMTDPIPQTLLEKLRAMSEKAKAAVFGRKQKKLDRIMTLFAKQEKITNDEVEKLLHVSDATAARYLDALETQGKIRQTGRTGKYTFYTAE